MLQNDNAAYLKMHSVNCMGLKFRGFIPVIHCARNGMVAIGDSILNVILGKWYHVFFHCFLQAPSMSLSRSNSREQLGGGSDSDNWRERNGIDSSHNDYSSSIGSPKRKLNKSGKCFFQYKSEKTALKTCVQIPCVPIDAPN